MYRRGTWLSDPTLLPIHGDKPTVFSHLAIVATQKKPYRCRRSLRCRRSTNVINVQTNFMKWTLIIFFHKRRNCYYTSWGITWIGKKRNDNEFAIPGDSDNNDATPSLLTETVQQKMLSPICNNSRIKNSRQNTFYCPNFWHEARNCFRRRYFGWRCWRETRAV